MDVLLSRSGTSYIRIRGTEKGEGHTTLTLTLKSNQTDRHNP